MVRPSRRREMAHKVVSEQGVCIRLACVAFRISESCYRYERKLDAVNEEGGCPEFCVNGASVNSSASFPQIECVSSPKW